MSRKGPEFNIVVDCSLPQVTNFPLPNWVEDAYRSGVKPKPTAEDSPCFFYNPKRPGLCGSKKCPFINPLTGRL